MTDDLLPSWRPGPTRDALTAFLGASADLPTDRRVAVFDNDGTLWCERPRYVQFDFFVDELARAVRARPDLGELPEYAAVLTGDLAAAAKIGLPRVALALGELFAGMTPEAFAERARSFLASARHPTLGRPWTELVYQPMVELLETLRAHGFSTFVVTGGGTEFVRAVSTELYGVAPEGVVGTHIAYEYVVGVDGPGLVRTAVLDGAVNEGPAKVAQIQRHLGRRPALAAGNTNGDAEMLAWASAGAGPSLALLVDHDDADREFAYEGSAVSVETALGVKDLARRSGWVVVSMREDWSQVFPER